MGNPEEMAHQQYTDYSSFISAFQEPDFGAKNAILRYSHVYTILYLVCNKYDGSMHIHSLIR